MAKKAKKKAGKKKGAKKKKASRRKPGVGALVEGGRAGY